MKTIQSKNYLIPFEEIVSNDVVYKDNIANVLCIAQDLHPDYLTILASVISQTFSRDLLTVNMELFLRYDYGRNAKRAAKKFKAAASVEYVETMQKCVVPIFLNADAEIFCCKDDSYCGNYYSFFIYSNKEFDFDGQFLVVKSSSLKLQEILYVYHAYCYKRDDGYQFVVPNQDEVSKFTSLEKITVFRKPDSREFENWCRLARDVYKLDDVACKVFDTVDIPPISSMIYPNLINRSLNLSQLDAVNGLLNQHPRNVFVLFGPPGTGKTYTLIAAIEAIKKAYELKNQIFRFLICAHSNMAADNFALALIKSGIFKNTEMFRAYSPHLSRTVRNPLIYNITRQHEGKFIIPKSRIWGCGLRVVISTIGFHHRLLKAFDTTAFTHIYVDEAGQARDAEVIMPLFTFGNVNTKFAIAGDPKQLDPVIVSSVLRYKSYNSKLSTISRLNDHPEYEEFRKNKRNFVTLNTNYRSQTEICTLVSNIIYENKLISSDPSDCNDFIGCEILKNKEIPIVFWDVNGAEKSVNTSFMNQEEIDQVFQTIENIFKLHEIYISQSDIGVVTPYKANVFGIKKRLEAVYPEITVDSVERYQGSERDVIIISTVRTKKLGFLCDPKRLCTAISRPRKLLVLIGCVPMLIKDPKWKELIEFLHKNNCIFSS